MNLFSPLRFVSRPAIMFAVAALSILPFVGPAGAYTVITDGSGNNLYWTNSTIKWYLHPSGSADVPFNELKSAMTSAFQSFKNISCFSKSFSYGGTKSYNPEDGIYVKFKESNWDPTVGDAAAYAQSWTGWGGKISYSVIVFNGVDITWTTTEADDFFSQKTDIQGVGAHELGHCLGLDHSRHREATMFFSGGSAELRSLEPDDKDGICFIYANFTQGKPCDSCKSDSNCKSGYCLEYPDEGMHCGQNCTSDSNCPDLFYCYDIQSGTDQCVADNGYCNQAGNNIPLGYFCYGQETCESGLCLVVPDTAYCSKECTLNSQCPSPLKCISGLCIMGGSTPLGGDCKSHMDCQSGLCLGTSDDGGVCTKECDDDGDCPPNGFACSMGYCLKGGDIPYGSPCGYDMECETMSCIPVEGEKMCTYLCDDSGDCPGKDPCTYGICVPPGNVLFLGKCSKHTDCKSGFCAGNSNKFCSEFCDTDNDCPNQTICVSGGYCVKQQTPSDQCMKDSDCTGSQFCKQAGAGTAGKCVPGCNPFADMGCAPDWDCQWVYVAWEDAIKGECVPDNGGVALGGSCSMPNAPCIPSLVCINVGGSGQKCYKDCNIQNGFGCNSSEDCLPLSMGSDPHHGVCVCTGPDCTPDPTEDVTPQPVEDIVTRPDNGGTVPTDTGGSSKPDTRQPVDKVDDEDDDGDEDSGGCSAVPAASPPAAAALLLLLGLLLLVRRSKSHPEPCR